MLCSYKRLLITVWKRTDVETGAAGPQGTGKGGRGHGTGCSRAHMCSQEPQEALPPRQHTEEMWFGANSTSFVLTFMRCSKNTGENQAPSS